MGANITSAAAGSTVALEYEDDDLGLPVPLQRVLSSGLPLAHVKFGMQMMGMEELLAATDEESLNVLTIGISGKMHSGKDTLRRYLTKELRKRGLSVYCRRCAAPIKQSLAVLTGTTAAFQNTHEGKNTPCPLVGGATYGQLQVALGKGAREVYPNVWVDAVLRGIPPLNRERPVNTVVIIPDVRFRNEVDGIRGLGGVLIRINGDPSGAASKDKRDKSDTSEVSLDTWKDWDVVVDNHEKRSEEALSAHFAPVLAFIAGYARW